MQLARFEGYEINGEFCQEVLNDLTMPTPHRFQRREIEQLTAFCCDNVFAISRGATPNYYLSGCADGSVNGVVTRTE